MHCRRNISVYYCYYIIRTYFYVSHKFFYFITNIIFLFSFLSFDIKVFLCTKENTNNSRNWHTRMLMLHYCTVPNIFLSCTTERSVFLHKTFKRSAVGGSVGRVAIGFKNNNTILLYSYVDENLNLETSN